MTDHAERSKDFAIVFEHLEKETSESQDSADMSREELSEIDELRRLAFELQDPEPILLTIS